MDTINYLVVTFFISTSLMLGYLGLRFRSLNKQPMTHFGNGLLFVCVAFLIWTYTVAAHPANIEAVVTLGVMPLIGSFIMFLLAATSGIKPQYRMPIFLISGVILTLFIALRFFIYGSNPGFTENGFFAFNVDPVVLYFYAMIAAFNFIPAIYVVGRHIKNDLPRIGVELGLTLVAVGLVIMITSQEESLQVVNGFGIVIGFLAACLSTTRLRLDKNS